MRIKCAVCKKELNDKEGLISSTGAIVCGKYAQRNV